MYVPVPIISYPFISYDFTLLTIFDFLFCCCFIIYSIIILTCVIIIITSKIITSILITWQVPPAPAFDHLRSKE